MNFHGEKRSNETDESTTDPEAKLARKGPGKEAKLSYCGNLLVENGNELKPAGGIAWPCSDETAALTSDKGGAT
jgi:hypothetical protein